ncbi:MAG: energy transducer TonB [Nibricoccus sp.]
MKRTPLLLCLLGFALLGAVPVIAEPSTPPKPKLARGDRLPVVKKQVRPKYPTDLRKKGITGDVNVHIVVSSSGDVAEAEVIDSPNEQFSEAALEAVRQWKFEPGLKDGVPVAVRLKFPIQFRLRE